MEHLLRSQTIWWARWLNRWKMWKWIELPSRWSWITSIIHITLLCLAIREQKRRSSLSNSGYRVNYSLVFEQAVSYFVTSGLRVGNIAVDMVTRISLNSSCILRHDIVNYSNLKRLLYWDLFKCIFFRQRAVRMGHQTLIFPAESYQNRVL